MRQVLVFGLACLTLGTPLAAQELTDEELLLLFQQQRDAIAAAQSGDAPLTRGLQLIPVDDLVTEPELNEAADPTVISLREARLGEAEEADSAPDQGIIYYDTEAGIDVNLQIAFPFDSASLTPDQFPKLEQMCSVMQASDIGLFRIIGHTDASGSDDYNERLSLLRAQEVRRHLVNNCGLTPERLDAVGVGERFLSDPEDPRSADNRRVEFQALS